MRHRVVERISFSLEPVAIPGPFVIRSRLVEDNRGYLMETWSHEAFAALGIADAFVQDNQSVSRSAGTLRGLHFQRPPFEQAKLVRVVTGRILDVAVDLRRSS